MSGRTKVEENRIEEDGGEAGGGEEEGSRAEITAAATFRGAQAEMEEGSAAA